MPTVSTSFIGNISGELKKQASACNKNVLCESTALKYNEEEIDFMFKLFCVFTIVISLCPTAYSASISVVYAHYTIPNSCNDKFNLFTAILVILYLCFRLFQPRMSILQNYSFLWGGLFCSICQESFVPNGDLHKSNKTKPLLHCYGKKIRPRMVYLC